MPTYHNTKTGAEIVTRGVIQGGDWVETPKVAPPVKPSKPPKPPADKKGD